MLSIFQWAIKFDYQFLAIFQSFFWYIEFYSRPVLDKLATPLNKCFKTADSVCLGFLQGWVAFMDVPVYLQWDQWRIQKILVGGWQNLYAQIFYRANLKV